MRTLITIVRHGETEWNVAMRLQGKQDSALTKRGVRQASQVAEGLKSRVFDVFISSDLGRAVHTARAINKYHKMNIEFSEVFRERNFGVMEGLSLKQIKELFPNVHEGYVTRTTDYQVPEGESLLQFSKRVIDGINSLAKNNQGKRILLVAHGGVLDCLLRMVFDLSLDSTRKFSIYNASINTFSYESGLWKLEEWGNIDHFDSSENPRDEL